MDWILFKRLSKEGIRMLTNSSLVYFSQNMVGAPYWAGTSCLKATYKVLDTYKARFPDLYKQTEETYERHILEREIVTDALGLVKGFAWNNGGQKLLESRGTDVTFYGMPGSNGCPDKTIKGMFTWSISQGAKWGTMENIPNLPGIILVARGRVGVYEGNNQIIEANSEAGKVIYTPLQKNEWIYWFCLPFIEYIENPENIILEEEQENNAPLAISGMAIALDNVISKEQANEASKFLDIISKDEQVEIFNDSNDQWLHIFHNGIEKYSFSQYFLIYTFKPDIMSKDKPTLVDKTKAGWYNTIKNISIRDQASPRGKIYVNIPENTKIYDTGARKDKWSLVCAQFKNRTYVGYILSNMLR